MNAGTRSSRSWLLSWEILEEKPIGFFKYSVSLAAIIITRNVLEAFSGTGFTEQPGSYLLHYPLAYIAPLLALSCTLSILSKVPVIRVTRLMLYVWLLTLLPPLLDMLVSTGTESRGAQIGYLPVEQGEYWSTFINFFNPGMGLKGATVGIRLEALIACLMSFLYVYVKSRNLLRSIVAPLIIFAVSFFFFTFPNIYLALVKLFDPDVKDFTDLFLTRGVLIRTDTSKLSLIIAQVDLILLAIVFVIWLGLYRGVKGVTHLYKLLFQGRTATAATMTFLGFLIGWRIILPYENFQNLLSHHSDFLSLISLLLAAVAASAGISCLEPDKDSQSENESEIHSMEMMFVLLAFASANTLVIGFAPFCFLLIYVSAALFRESPPFQLKRYPALSSLAKALGSVALISMSYSLFTGSRTPSYFPRTLLVMLFAALAIGFFAVQLGEHGGDKNRSVQKRHVWIFKAVLFCLAYLIPAFYFRNLTLLIASLIAAILSSMACILLKSRAYLGLVFVVYLVTFVSLLFAEFRDLKNRQWGTPHQIRHAELASMYLSEGNPEHARVEYEAAAELGSPDPSIYYGLGFDYSQAGNDLMAIEMFKRATELDTTYSEAYYNLAISYSHMDMDGEAIRNFMKATALNPENMEIRLGSTGTLLKKGYLEEAMTIILTDMGETVKEQMVLFEILNTLSQQNFEIEFDTAGVAGRFLERFKTAMQHGKQREWNEALFEISHLEAEFPKAFVLSYFRAWINQMMGNMEEAILLYRQLLERVPGMYEAMINLGAAYLNLGKLDEVRKISLTILGEHPGDVKALVNLANSYTREGKLDRSLELLTRALKEDPENYGVRMNLAIVLEGLSRIDEAIIQYQTLLIMNKESPEVYTKISECYIRKGDIQKARENLEYALSLNPKYKPALKAMTKIAQQSTQGKPE